MTTRKRAGAKTERGGQALVMVTLALIAMCGMMGLAVDLGWSFFVQKQAQVAADAAALGAVQEAYGRQRPCAQAGSLTQMHCALPAANCSTITDQSNNLLNGCKYAERNGFVSGSNRQVVTIEANVDNQVPRDELGVSDVNYYVRVRVAQTIPQLFSSIMGNTQGTISAIATAGLAAVVTPGSFYGLNREGDCLSNAAGALYNCGVDVDLTGANAGACMGQGQAKLCAPAGMFLASQCNGTSKLGCGSGSGGALAAGTNYAGQTTNGPNVVGSTINIAGSGLTSGNFSPTPTPGNFTDPYTKVPQPPLLTPNSALGTCGVPNGVFPSVNGTLTVGPFQYYSYTPGAAPGPNGTIPPNGNPITVNDIVSFQPSGQCAFTGAQFTAGATQVNGTFPTTIFYGGLNASGNQSSVTFGPGQYVMAGTRGTTVFNMDRSNIAGNAPTGTMFITTDASYDGALTTQTAAPALAGINAVGLHMGSVQMKNRFVTLTGVTQNAPAAITQFHKNVLFWQDRRNSNVTLDTQTGALINQTRPPTSVGASPEFVTNHGNGNMTLTGVLYQPRGAWIRLEAGGAGIYTSPLQIVTGAVVCANPSGGRGCGNAGIMLTGPTAPIIKYVTALIQ